MARDHRSTYERRNQLAQAQGYRSYADARRQRAAGNPAPGDRTARPELRQIVPVGSGGRRIVRDLNTKGGGERVLTAQLGQASRVSITATAADGRVMNVLGKGGWSASRFADLVAELGSVAAAVAHVVAMVYGDDAGDSVAEFEIDMQ